MTIVFRHPGNGFILIRKKILKNKTHIRYISAILFALSYDICITDVAKEKRFYLELKDYERCSSILARIN